MNLRMIGYVLGKMLGVEALVLLIPAAVSMIYQQNDYNSFLITSAILGIVYLLIGRKKPKQSTIYGKEGLVIVAVAWILWSFFGAIPFVLSGSIPNFIDAFFETVSGFTTTGSTILTEIESLPRGILFWRSLTHWIGGMGVLVFVMMLTSLEDKNAMHLMRAEVPGPEADKLVPKARNTAKILYMMYFALTVAEIIFLLMSEMDLYDSIVHAFSTAGTGGFSSWNASIAHYDSAYIDVVITIFMILFGINFNLYYLLLLKEIKAIFKNEELRVYLGIIAGAIVIITCNIIHMYENVFEALRYASFQVAAIITTTGFCTTDFNLWPELSKCILLTLMVVGASAGSTGGGIKVSRLMILLKSIKQEMHRLLHPKAVTIVKVNGRKISSETMHGVNLYFICYVMIIIVSVLLVSFDNFDFETTFTAVLTTMNNVGPGLSLVGPVENFAKFSVLSKLVFCMDMLVGRLEIFPFLLLFSPNLWRKRF